MDNRFDRWAMSIAGATSRREALRRMGRGLLAALLAPMAVGKARAGHICNNPGICGTFQGCNGQNESVCLCGTTTEGVGVCVQDSLCTQVSACTTSQDCPSGQVCVIHTCCTAPQPRICLALCAGDPKTARVGPTASGR
jgi:hypothetical protein